MIVWLLIIAGVVALDQGTKLLVLAFLDKKESFVLIPNVFRFTYVENDGMAFGFLGEQRWIFIIISVIGIAAMLIYLWKFRPESKIACIALSMVIGGGIGNMIDRMFFTSPETGKKVVIDFLDFYAFPSVWRYVFNVADSFVCIGAGMLIVWCIFSLFEEGKSEYGKKKKVSVLNENKAEEEIKKDLQEGEDKPL